MQEPLTTGDDAFIHGPQGRYLLVKIESNLKVVHEKFGQSRLLWVEFSSRAATCQHIATRKTHLFRTDAKKDLAEEHARRDEANEALVRDAVTVAADLVPDDAAQIPSAAPGDVLGHRAGSHAPRLGHVYSTRDRVVGAVFQQELGDLQVVKPTAADGVFLNYLLLFHCNSFFA